MEKWNASVIQHEEQEQMVTQQLTGLSFNISGTIPVASAFEKPFTVFIIEMKNKNLSVTILKRYRQLLVRVKEIVFVIIAEEMQIRLCIIVFVKFTEKTSFPAFRERS